MCFLDGQIKNTDMNDENINGLLLAIKEVKTDDHIEEDIDDHIVKPVAEYGICMIDPVRSTVTLGQFADDILRTRMRTLITSYPAAEILLEANNDDLIQICKATCPRAQLEFINAEEVAIKSTALDVNVRNLMDRPNPIHPWDARETIQEVKRRNYFEKYPEVKCQHFAL